jgi:hypothetical protein
VLRRVPSPQAMSSPQAGRRDKSDRAAAADMSRFRIGRGRFRRALARRGCESASARPTQREYNCRDGSF